MANVYEVRLKAAALENLKAAREEVRRLIGSSQVGERLENLAPAQAGELANALLELLDRVDSVVTRAKAAD